MSNVFSAALTSPGFRMIMESAIGILAMPFIVSQADGCGYVPTKMNGKMDNEPEMEVKP